MATLSLPKPSGAQRVGVEGFDHVADKALPFQVYFPMGRGEHSLGKKRFEPSAPAGVLEVDVYARQAHLFDYIGKERPVVFLNHGHMVAMTDYAYLAEDLASHGYIVIAAQHQVRGEPTTPIYLEERSVAKYACIIDNIFDLFVWINDRMPVRQVGLIGHSMGANALLLLAQRAIPAFKPKTRNTLLPFEGSGPFFEAIVALDPGGFPYPPRADYPLFLALSEERLAYHESSGSLADIRAIGHTVKHYPGSKHISFMDWGYVNPENPIEPGEPYFNGSDEERYLFFDEVRRDVREFLTQPG